MHLLRAACLSFFAYVFSAACFAQQPAAAPLPDALQRADAAFRAGYAALQSGDLAAARAKFAEAAQLAPQIPEAHEALAETLIELGKPAEAIPELQTALRLKPPAEAQGLQSNLALAYAKSGDPAGAIPYFAAAYQSSQSPGQPAVDAAFCEAYARALAATGKSTEAITLFQAAIDRAPSRADLFDAEGSLYAQALDWKEARRQFEQALALDSSYVPARIHLGIVLRQQHEFDASLSALNAAAALEPANPLAQLELARSLAAAGQDEAAIQHLQQALQLDPAIPGIQNELAMALQRDGRQQEAIPYFRQAVAQDPRNASALANLGLALTLTGKAAEALPWLQQARALLPNDPTIIKDQGVAHVQLSAFDEAIADFHAALALDPNDPQLHYDLGMAYKFKDRMDDAIAELTRAGQMDPALPDPPYTLGILYMQIGKLDDAVVELRKAAALRPDNGDTWAILGSTLKQDGRLDEAEEALQHAIPLLPGQPGPRVTLAGVLAEQAGAVSQAADAADAAGDHDKAEQLRTQLKALRAQAAGYRRDGADLARGAANRQKASFAMNAGNQLMLRGQIADAIARYQEAIAADPTFPDPHAQLAIAFEREGRAQDAAAERARAATLNLPR